MIYRRIILLFILATLLFSFAERKYRNDLAEENLKGKVKMITEQDYSIKRKSPKDSTAVLEFKYIRLYDLKGNMVEESTYYGTAFTPRERDKYQYNDKGIRLSKESYRDTNMTRHYTYQADAEANIIGEELYSKGKLAHRGTYTYDSKGNNIEYKTIGTRDSMVMSNQYAYDPKGMLIQESSSIQGKLIWLHKYQYNAKSERSETQYIGRDNKPLATEKYNYQYDTKDNWISMTTTIRDSVTRVADRKIEYWP